MNEVFVCKRAEFAEDSVRIVEIHSTEVAVIRHQDAFYAYKNVCPHQGGPVCEGVRMPRVVDVLDADKSFLHQTFDNDDIHIVCPWHGYEFHLATGVNVCQDHIRLTKYPVVERNGDVYVEIP